MKRLVLLVALLAPACVTGPTNDTEVASYAASVPMQGYVFAGNAPVDIQVLNQATGLWETIATAYSDASPSVPANTIGQNQDLYYWYANIALAAPTSPATLCRWSPTCVIQQDKFGSYVARLRAVYAGQPIITFEENWGDCLSTELAAGRDLTNAALNCKSHEGTEVRLRDVYEWTRVHATATTGAPAIAAVAEDSYWLYAASVSAAGTINISRSCTPGVWEAMAPPAGPPDVINGAAGVALVAQSSWLYLLVVGADGDLYVSLRNVGAWGAFQRLTTGAQIAGRLSATLTQGAATEIHVLYRTLAPRTLQRAMVYRRFRYFALTSTLELADAADGSIGSDGVSQIAIALKKIDRLSVLTASAAQGWQPLIAGERAVSPEDVSRPVFFRGEVHVAHAERGAIDPFYGTQPSEVRDLRLIGGGVQSSIIASYLPSKARAPQLDLAVYRAKLVAAWIDGSPGLHTARLDDVDPTKPWVGHTTVGKSALAERPALLAFRARPMGAYNTTAWTTPAYGNDLYAATVRFDRALLFANASRAMMRREIDRQFELYDYGLSDGCPAQPQANAPVLVRDLWSDDRALVTELGYSLWMLPNWLVDGLYQRVARDWCDTSRFMQQGRIRQPCNRARMPVMFKPTGGAYVCQDGNYVNRSSDYLQIFEELGHQMSEALGISLYPLQQQVTISGIPLATLRAGHNLFFERVLQCSAANAAGVRCPGFAGIAGNYDNNSRDHSFIYVVYMYIKDPVALRGFVAEDLGTGDDLLQRKYNWVKDNIFRGVEL
ncbi:MAG: hypothetical protein IT381_03335 [Deltaproteobacteria bacterium]|nr:hypothetical protein [Deltaproteobacteria bacterium]